MKTSLLSLSYPVKRSYVLTVVLVPIILVCLIVSCTADVRPMRTRSLKAEVEAGMVVGVATATRLTLRPSTQTSQETQSDIRGTRRGEQFLSGMCAKRNTLNLGIISVCFIRRYIAV